MNPHISHQKVASNNVTHPSYINNRLWKWHIIVTYVLAQMNQELYKGTFVTKVATMKNKNGAALPS